MARRTNRNRILLAFCFMLVSAVAWACVNGGYISPPDPASNSATNTGNRDYGNRSCSGCSDFHPGWDLGTNQNTAASGGTVEVRNQTEYGNVVTITNGNFRTTYAHACSVNSNLNGTTVNAGQALGDWSSCCTGNCSGCDHVGSASNPCQTGKHIDYQTQVQSSNGQWRAVDPAIVSQMLAEGKDPCSNSFADEAVKRTQDKHGKVANGLNASGGTPGAVNGGDDDPNVTAGSACAI